MIYITHIRMAGGTGHEHISHVQWRDDVDNTNKHCTAEVMVDFIDEKKGAVYVKGERGNVLVGVMKVGNRKFLRTYANGDWSDNLLSLPHF